MMEQREHLSLESANIPNGAMTRLEKKNELKPDASASLWKRTCPALESAAVFASFCILFLYVLFTIDGFLTFDGFFHYRAAGEMIHGRTLWPDIVWLPYSVLGDIGTNHHWLWHLLVAPFTLFSDDETGLRVAIACTGAIVPTVIHGFLRNAHVPFRLLFTVLSMAAAMPIPGRFLMLRAQNIAVCLVLMCLVAAAKGRLWLLTVLSCLFMWSYHGAIIVPALLFLYAVPALLKKDLTALRPVLYASLGCLIGLSVNPWFPHTFEYLFFHVFYKMMFPLDPLAVGGEWMKPPLSQMGIEAAVAHLVLAIGAIRYGVRKWYHRKSVHTRTETRMLCLSALVFLWLYSSSWRFVEYYAPVAVIAGALLFRDAGWRRFSPSLRHRFASTFTRVVVSGVAVLALLTNLAYVQRSSISHFRAFEPIALFLDRHEEENRIVFNSRWPDFVSLIWHTRRFRFVNGLDPHYLMYGDPKRYVIWRRLTQEPHRLDEDPAILIQREFDASFAVIHPRDQTLVMALQRSPLAILRVQSPSGLLFQLNPPPAEEPATDRMQKTQKEEQQ